MDESETITQEGATTSQEARWRDHFIIDNSISGWTALRYLKEWADIAKAFDIATGHFDIGALIALHGKWLKLTRFRGAHQAFNGGFSDAQDAPALFT